MTVEGGEGERQLGNGGRTQLKFGPLEEVDRGRIGRINSGCWPELQMNCPGTNNFATSTGVSDRGGGGRRQPSEKPKEGLDR